MTALIPPGPDRYDEWLAVVRDFGGAHMDGSGFFTGRRPVPTPEGYADHVAAVLAEGDPEVPAEPGRVKCSYFWIVDDQDVFVGFLALRRILNDFLLEQGGHIGYSVRPSRRREGHAHRALALGVDEAARIGIDPVLVTCEEDNEASRRTIEGNGGRYEDTRQGKRRYWLSP